MARNQHQLISTVQSTGRIITGAVNKSTDVTMKIGGAILDQADRQDLKRKKRDDDISAQLQQLLTLKQAAREPICSEDPVACTTCTVLSEPNEISWTDGVRWQCPVCETINEYVCIIPEASLPSLVASGLRHWQVGDDIISRECCICMTDLDMQECSPVPGCSTSFSHTVCAVCSTRLGSDKCPQCRSPWDPTKLPQSSVLWALLREDANTGSGADGESVL